MQEDPQFSSDQIRETHKHYSDEIMALLLQGLETAMQSGTVDSKLRVVRA